MKRPRCIYNVERLFLALSAVVFRTNGLLSRSKHGIRVNVHWVADPSCVHVGELELSLEIAKEMVLYDEDKVFVDMLKSLNFMMELH